jgi:hypothetical protein
VQPRFPIDNGRESPHLGALENLKMNEYQVTYANGEVVEIEAWTPELAQAIAEEEAEQDGRPSLAVVSVELLTAQQTEL